MSSVTYNDKMFNGTTALIGGNGPTSYIDRSYAYVDDVGIMVI